MNARHVTVQRWLSRAAHDLQTAQTMIGLTDPPTDVVCFHCQQCAEKCLKAFLVCVGQDFPKTHDLPELLGLCARHDQEFGRLEQAAVALTPYAVATRYVEAWRDITRDEAIQAIEWAVLVRDFVCRQVGTSGLHDRGEAPAPGRP